MWMSAVALDAEWVGLLSLAGGLFGFRLRTSTWRPSLACLAFLSLVGPGCPSASWSGRRESNPRS